ncbi:MaoC family dehydratase N-terminal domain-containing protein [Nonomuraea terrae]|uniref:FAS1-like dehydratase domain-containing protein n=1 Tax=Nonomuraea terrae TaxID=2530383 RepID=UPI0037A4A7CA
MTATETETGVATGAEEDGRAMIGHRSQTRFADHPVNDAMVRHYCAATEDPNPHYWRPETGVTHWGGTVSPPGLLTTWLMPLQWTPERGHACGSGNLAPRLPLPGTSMINVATDTTFFRPIYQGVRLNATEEVVDVSETKRTRLGTGNFVTTLVVYRDEAGERVAESRNTLFRFTPVEEA